MPHSEDDGLPVLVRAGLAHVQFETIGESFVAVLGYDYWENQLGLDPAVLERLISTLSAAFAVLATILAAVGLYGVLAYTGAYRLEPLVIPPMPRTSCALCQNS